MAINVGRYQKSTKLCNSETERQQKSASVEAARRAAQSKDNQRTFFSRILKLVCN